MGPELGTNICETICATVNLLNKQGQDLILWSWQALNPFSRLLETVTCNQRGRGVGTSANDANSSGKVLAANLQHGPAHM